MISINEQKLFIDQVKKINNSYLYETWLVSDDDGSDFKKIDKVDVDRFCQIFSQNDMQEINKNLINLSK